MPRPATRGPGSNQHQDKPPLAPREPATTVDATNVAVDPLDEPYYADELDELLDIPSPRPPRVALVINPNEDDWASAPTDELVECVTDAMIDPSHRINATRAARAAEELVGRGDLDRLDVLRDKNPRTFDRLLPDHADVIATSKVNTNHFAAVLASEEKDGVRDAIAFSGAMTVPLNGDSDERQDVLYDQALDAANGHVYARLSGVVVQQRRTPDMTVTPDEAEQLVSGVGLNAQVYKFNLPDGVSPDIARALAVEARETGKRAMEKAAGRTYRSGYADVINDAIAETGMNHLRPEWVEANMRSEYGTLDALPRSAFADEARLTHELWRTSGSKAQDDHARSWGLTPVWKGRE